MIVCNGCGLAVSAQGMTCNRCSGRGIGTPTQRCAAQLKNDPRRSKAFSRRPRPVAAQTAGPRGSASPLPTVDLDDSYTTPPSAPSNREPALLNPSGTMDIPLDQAAETLARGVATDPYLSDPSLRQRS